MSAHVVSDETIYVMVHAAMRESMTGGMRWDGQELDPQRWDDIYGAWSAVGTMLAAECTASVDYRYNETSPVPVYVHAVRRRGVITPLEVLRVISHYEYQSCEHPGWDTSEARSFCDALRHAMVWQLPGFKDCPADWTAEDLDSHGATLMAGRWQS